VAAARVVADVVFLAVFDLLAEEVAEDFGGDGFLAEDLSLVT
jgi:hypothetical protein